MSNVIRFLFNGNDVGKVATSTIRAEDILPGPGSPVSGSLLLKFRQNDPGPVQVCPLFPGTVHFLPDPAGPGRVPDPTTDSFTEMDYPSWNTLGRLLVTVTDPKTAKDIDALAPALLVKPNKVWYGPVRLSSAFLFHTLIVGLKKSVIKSATRTIGGQHKDWFKHAIAEFLQGRYAPLLNTSVDPAQDDRVRFVMPTVDVPPSGDIELWITTALAQNPQDAPDAAFDDLLPPVDRDDPRHPRNGLIPTREVYRQLRSNMVNDPAAQALTDACLADWPVAPRFFPISFTRTWELIPNCSVHFPRQTARIESGGALLHEERLPAHGIVYVRQNPATPQPVPPSIDVSLTAGGMTWVGGGGDSWRTMGLRAPITFDLATTPRPHVSVRLPMSAAMFADVTRTHGRPLSCTYHSLRRTVRALIDNRIAGGRLNFGVDKTTPVTRGIIQRAFAGTFASVALVANNAPDPSGDPDQLAPTLIPILEAFFPNNMLQQALPNPPQTPMVYKAGRAAYHVWQTNPEAFQDNATQRNFSETLIGRGGPGAAALLGLSTFRVDPARAVGEADDAYFDRVVGLILTGLQPGALLQFWHVSTDLDDIKARAVPARPDPPGPDRIKTLSYGHSPIFVGYVTDSAGTVTGIRILDQHGEHDQLVQGTAAAGDRRLPWLSAAQQLWIAANWNE